MDDRPTAAVKVRGCALFQQKNKKKNPESIVVCVPVCECYQADGVSSKAKVEVVK